MKNFKKIIVGLLTTTVLSTGVYSLRAAESSPAATSKTEPAKSRALDLARQLNEAFIEVADQVSPAVVVITVTEKATVRQQQDSSDDGSFWDMLPPELRRRFNRENPDGGGRNGRNIPKQRAELARGSGIVITEDGYILTNNHVVENAEKISVRFKDGKEVSAEVKGRDPQSDVAVIKVDVKGLAHAKLGDSSAARVGEFAIAIGAPFGDLDYSVTVGHISAKGRSFWELGGYADQDFLQTDASINPGNSGGPLVNLYGEVIGINSMIRGMNTGIGFAIPINLAKQVSDHLIKDGKFVRSRIGVGIAGLREVQDYKEQIPGLEDGVVITQIMADGPAAKSDLKAGDVVVAVDGKPIKTSRELKEEISYKKVGQTVTLDVVRMESQNDKKNLKIKVKTDAIPDRDNDDQGKKSPTDATEPSSFGLTVKALDKNLADEYGIDITSGLIVTAVESGSSAEDKGISPGDIITDVNRKSVSNLKQFRDAIKTSNPKKGIVVNLISKGSSRIVVLKEE